MNSEAVISIVGGTGKLGSAIAGRLARAGHKVVIGSRSADSAKAAASLLGAGVEGRDNVVAARVGDIIIVTVPYAAQEATLRQIAAEVQGKLVVDTTVPLTPPKVMRVTLPEEGSAAMRAQMFLGAEANVVAAFHNVAAHKLAEDGAVDCDVLVFGDDKNARSKIVALVDSMGLRGLHGGVLANAAAAEALTSVLIFMNRHYAADGAGIRITGKTDIA